MKKTITLLLALFLCVLTLCGCANKGKLDPNTLQPNNTKLQSICNLATLECYYHNVAKSETKGFWNLESSKKTFWIEYTGIVKIGIDFSKVKTEINGTEVSITMPKAMVLDKNVDAASYNENSFYAEKNTLLNGKVSAEEQTAAINEAQEKMVEAAQSNEALLQMAQNRAKEMMENYVKQLGVLTETDYHIKWVDLPTEQSQAEQE